MLTQVKIIPLLLFVFSLSCGKNKSIHLFGETMGTTYQITIITNTNNKVDAIQLQKKVDSLFTRVNNIFSIYIEKIVNNNNSHTDYFFLFFLIIPLEE